MDWLSDDLLLLTIVAYRGRVGRAYAIGYALMGAELIQLAARGQIEISGDQIVVTSAEPTGDAELDAVLGGIAESVTPPRSDEWVARPRPWIHRTYLERLQAVGVVRVEKGFSAPGGASRSSGAWPKPGSGWTSSLGPLVRPIWARPPMRAWPA